MRATMILCEKATLTAGGFDIKRGGITDLETHPGMRDREFDLLMIASADPLPTPGVRVATVMNRRFHG